MDNKKKILWIALGSVFVIIFNAFFFLIGGTEHNLSVWLSYGFIHLAYFMIVLTPIITRGKNAVTTGFPLYTVSAIYFFIEFVVGVIFILIAPDSIKPTLLFQLSIAGVYAVVLIINLLANEHTADSEELQKAEVDFIRSASNTAKLIQQESRDRQVKREMEKVFDELNSSQTKSHPNVIGIENEIIDLLSVLERSSDDKETSISIAKTLVLRIKERNRQLKSLN
jgi:hypothetical protein